jgi:ubiquinone/menaquinone biosynthesis C-methylase UbiE
MPKHSHPTTHLLINPSEISKDFSKAAHTYKSNASIQKIMADNLLEQSHKSSTKLSGHTLDLGSGSGYLTQIFKKYFIEITPLPIDLSHSSLLIQSENKPLLSDFSNLPFKDKSVQNCISNAALQWSPNLEKSFFEINRVLKKGAFFCFTLLGPTHFNQLEEVHSLSNTDFKSPIQKYSKQEVERLISTLTWSTLSYQNHQIECHFNSLIEMLKHFKDTGVRANQKQHFPIKTFSKNWPRPHDTQQFPLSWNWHSWVIQVN